MPETPEAAPEEPGPPDLQAPLAIFRELSARLGKAGAGASQATLEGLYRHFSSALADVVEAARSHLEDGLERLRSAAQSPELPEEETPVAVRQLRSGFESAAGSVRKGLSEVEEILRASRSVGEVDGARGRLEAAGHRIRGGLDDLEALLDRLEEPELVTIPEGELPHQVPQALDLLSGALQSLHDYLGGRRRSDLEAAVASLDQAGTLLLQVLDAGPGPS